MFENLYIFFGIFWIIWKYVSHDAGGRTDTKRERKLFLVFFENEFHAVRATGQTQ